MNSLLRFIAQVLKIVLLTLLLLRGLACEKANGQSLTPKIRVIGTDTSFCFTTHQVRIMAKLLTKKDFLTKAVRVHQQMHTEHEQLISNKNRVIELQNEEISIREQQLQGKDVMIGAQARAIQQQSEMLEGLEKAVRKERRKRKVVTWLGSAAILTILIVL